MSAIYRSYEVLVEETASNHKTRGVGKTTKKFKPHFENTCRAMRVTHELFQDAVCYYILCLVGLAKNERDKDGEPINRMWEYLRNDPKTGAVLTRLVSRYPTAPFHKASTIVEFLSQSYGWLSAESDKPTPASLLTTYRILFQQAVKSDHEDDESTGLENLKTFASDWIAILCNEDGDTTIPGQGVFDRLHRKISTEQISESDTLWKTIEGYAQDSVREKDNADARWQERELAKTNARNAKSKKRKSEEELAKICREKWDKKLQSNRSALKTLFLKAFSASKVKKYCSLNPEAIQMAITEIESATCDDKRFLRLRCGARDNNMEQPLFRYLWLRQDAKCGSTVANDLLEYVAQETPETELRNDEGKAVSIMPYQKTGKEPLFPYFTNCLGIRHADRAAWFEFDKSAFKRAAEEVFKYKLRTDEREELNAERKQKLDILKAEIQDDLRAPLMEKLLNRLGGAIGYGMRRATIGGWADLRKDFLRIAKKGEPIDEDELFVAIEKAREESGGGFGSGAFFKALCEEEYHPLWLPGNKDSQHPNNFVRWWVFYSEAKEEFKKVWDETTSQPKPIAFTWPSTKNRHDETSFRPLDFDILVTPTPVIDLFDRDGDGQPLKLVQTNATPPKKQKSVKNESADTPAFTDTDGNALYPLTLSYRRFKRDRIANAEGNSIEAEYATPLIVGESPKFPRKEKDKGKPLDSSASLLPADEQGCWHFMFSFKLEREMQKTLKDETAKIPGDKSVRVVKKNGKWVGLHLRWPIDLKTENSSKKQEVATVSPDRDKIEETDAKFSAKKIWCSNDFKPFNILSVDLGVRYAGAWCRARVKTGRDADRPNQRIISPADHAHEIVFDAYDFGTFRLQGEDAKIWRKDKHKGFGSEPEPEKCGSRGRVVSEVERLEFMNLAGRVFSPTVRLPIPSEPEELKFFPDLGNHLVYRLRRRLGQIRFLFKLRWQINGKKRKVGHEYKTLDRDELKTFRGEQRFNVIRSLAFIPQENSTEEGEDDFMRELRLKLASDGLWSKLAYECDGETYPLFSKVKGGRTKEEKTKSKKLKDAQKAAWAKLKQELELNDAAKWDWAVLAKAVAAELQTSMTVFLGEHSLIAEVARFVWPLQDKKWKWNNCTITKDGKIEQSFLERDDNSSEPKRFIHGMRGLNMKRICLMQDFRQCCQSLAKVEKRYYSDPTDKGLEPPEFGRGDKVHEPAQAFLDKINELRDQRVNQTAHMILAEALGLELMNPAEVTIDNKSKWELKSERDLHGRYKKTKQRVAAIVLEDLSRYRTSQDRSRYENSQLMEWSHRAIIEKLQDMAQVFGIQIITVDARFSSRFCSRTGVPGIRCAQVAKGFENDYPWKKWKDEKFGKADKDGKRQLTERANMILLAAEKLNLSDNPKATLVLPLDGGPAFLPVVSHDPSKEGLQENADIGAAVNIGMRPVAHPDRLDVFPVLRTEAKADGKLEIKNRRGSLSEAATKAESRTVSIVELSEKKKTEEKETVSADDDSGGDEELESGKFPYLYVAVRVGNNLSVPIDGKDRYQLPLTADGREVAAGDGVGAAQGKIYWSRVKQDCWKRINRMNAKRLQKLGIEPPSRWIEP
jgi:IS605 OrfB family transposase